MYWKEQVLGLLTLFCFTVYVSAVLACNFKWKKIGCFHDNLKDRPLKQELLNRRDIFSNVNDGKIIDWNNWEDTMQSLACACAERVFNRGFTHFGLQFYGECWSGQNSSTRFFKDGMAPNCIGTGYKPCNDATRTPCVGPAAVNYIYAVVPKIKTPNKIDGKYTPWSEWTKCSASCGAGMQFRDRTCTNPSPSNGGKDCTAMGPPEEGRRCNVFPCDPVCHKAIDLGFLLDASSSIGADNYVLAKNFIKSLVEHFEIGARGTHVGIIHYAWQAHVDFTFADSQYYDIVALEAKIDSIVYSYGGTRADLALLEAEKKLFCRTCGVRLDKPHVLITMTDAHIPKFSIPLIEASAGLRKLNVTLIAIGIGGVKLEELKNISSGDDYIFTSDTVKDLPKKLLKIFNASCPE